MSSSIINEMDAKSSARAHFIKIQNFALLNRLADRAAKIETAQKHKAAASIKTSPRIANWTGFEYPPSQMNCGIKDRKNSATLGLSAFIRNPRARVLGRLSLGVLEILRFRGLSSIFSREASNARTAKYATPRH